MGRGAKGLFLWVDGFRVGHFVKFGIVGFRVIFHQNAGASFRSVRGIDWRDVVTDFSIFAINVCQFVMEFTAKGGRVFDFDFLHLGFSLIFLF